MTTLENHLSEFEKLDIYDIQKLNDYDLKKLNDYDIQKLNDYDLKKLNDYDIQKLNDYDLKKLSAFDLEKLLKQDVKGKFDSDDDIPSLLLGGATTSKACGDKLNEVISSSTENKRPGSVSSTVSTTDAHEKEHLEQGGFYSSQECLQPSILNVKIPGKGIFKISNSKTCLTPIDTQLVIEKHSIICDEIFGEIDSESIRALDKHLNQIEELHDVYEEVNAAINQDCFDFYENAKEFAPLECNMVFMSNLTEKIQNQMIQTRKAMFLSSLQKKTTQRSMMGNMLN